MMMSTNFLLGIFGLGGPEMILIGVVILVFFGGSKIPELAKGLGRGIREFKDASNPDPSNSDKDKNSSNSSVNNFKEGSNNNTGNSTGGNN